MILDNVTNVWAYTPSLLMRIECVFCSPLPLIKQGEITVVSWGQEVNVTHSIRRAHLSLPLCLPLPFIFSTSSILGLRVWVTSNQTIDHTVHNKPGESTYFQKHFILSTAPNQIIGGFVIYINVPVGISDWLGCQSSVITYSLRDELAMNSYQAWF